MKIGNLRSFFRSSLCVIILFFSSCQKNEDIRPLTFNKKENISRVELNQWAIWYKKSIPNGPDLLMNNIRKTYVNNEMLLEIPLSSGGGAFYFIKRKQLEVAFMRRVSITDSNKTTFTGYIELINMNSFKYQKIDVKDGLIKKQHTFPSNGRQLVENTTIQIRSNSEYYGSWFGALLYCIGKYIFVIPRRESDGGWGCYGLGGGDGENQVPQPPEGGGDSGPSTVNLFDWSQWFQINFPPTYGGSFDYTNWTAYSGGGGGGNFYDTYGIGDPYDPNNIGDPSYGNAINYIQALIAPPFVWSYTGDDGSSFVDPDPLVESDLRFDPSDNYETLFPRFTQMVKGLKSFVKNSPEVMSALVKYSGFSKTQILNHLTFGQGPTIKIQEMNDRFGFYNKNTSASTLFISASYVRGLEQAFLERTKQGTAFLLAVTILHEFVHFGTASNNKSEGVYEFGIGFEKDAFHVVVNETNANKVVINFSKYF